MGETPGDNEDTGLSCPYCSGELKYIEAECIHCGKAVFTCPECGSLIKDDDVTCPSCGTEFVSNEILDGQEMEGTPPEVEDTLDHPIETTSETRSYFVGITNITKELRQNVKTDPREEIESKFFQPNINFLQSFVVLLFLLAAIGFMLEFTILEDYWYEHFNGYNLYLMIVTASGVVMALYVITTSTPETPTERYEDRRRRIAGIVGLIVALLGLLLLLVFRKDPSPLILVLNIAIFYGVFAAIQMSKVMPMDEVKKLFIVFTGVLIILIVPVHEAFGPYRTDFQNLPWHPVNEALLVIGISLAAYGFAALKKSTSYLAIWMYGLLILFLVPFHETAGIIASGNYEPWDHALAIIGIVTSVAGGAGFLAKKHKFDSIAQYLVRGNEQFVEENYGGALENYAQARDIAINAHIAFQFSTPWHSIGNVFANTGNEQRALANYERALIIEPNDEVAWANKGSCLAQIKRRGEGLECYHKAVEINPHNRSVWIAKAVLETSMGRLEEAIHSYEQAKELEPTDAGIWTSQSEVYALVGDFEEALACLEGAQRIEPNNSYLWLRKAQIYRNLENDHDATMMLKRILEQNPKDKWAIVETADVLYHQKNYTSASNTLTLLPPEDRTNNRIRVLESKILLALGNTKGSIEILENAMNDLGEQQEILATLAEAKDADGKKIESIEIYRKIVQKSRGILDYDQINRALECYASAITMHIDKHKAYVGTAEAFLKLDKHSEALESIQQAMTSGQPTAEIWQTNGICLMKLHRYSDAIKCFENGLSIEPENIDLWFNKGNTLARMNKFNEAIGCYNKTLSIDPHHIPSITNRNLCIRTKSFKKLIE